MSLTQKLDQLDKLKQRLDSHRPLSKNVLKNLQDDLILSWTYHSNAIEGNTLTLMETKVVLEGITVGGKQLREHFEAINHREAIYYLQDIVQQNQPLSEWQIRNIHQLILKNIDDEHAGRYRQQNVIISGASHTPPDSALLNDKMAQLIDWNQHPTTQTMHPVERACQLHTDFVNIHPFIDGNGRTARLLLNLALMKSGFPPCVIQVKHRLAYYEALDTWAISDQTKPFIKLICDELVTAFDTYWTVLGI